MASDERGRSSLAEPVVLLLLSRTLQTRSPAECWGARVLAGQRRGTLELVEETEARWSSPPRRHAICIHFNISFYCTV